MTTSIPFERWELEYISDCFPTDPDSEDVLQLLDKILKARDMLRKHEQALIEAGITE